MPDASGWVWVGASVAYIAITASRNAVILRSESVLVELSLTSLSIDPVVSSTSMMSVLTKFSDASQVTLSGSVVNPKIRMIEVGMVVDAVTRIVPDAGLVTTGVKVAVL